ncbi:hypothetical protein AB0M32_17165 [Streptomyces sp. NPDC051985]|uniref:DNA polymerase Y family protein n=1 Tax=Streptomyces sp. NPDC051985 TaxID=3155807 RepID=UPI003438BD79
MASARTDRGGVLVVESEETEQFLGPLPVGELYGIRRAQCEQLRHLGVETIGQLAGLPAATALQILGRHGRALQERARGIDHRAVRPGRTAASMSVRTHFPRDALDGPYARAGLLRLVVEFAALLRSRGQAARAVTLVVGMADQRDLSRGRLLPSPSAHTDDLRQTVHGVFDSFGLQRARMRRITLVAEAVDGGQAYTQLTLDRRREARLRVEPVVDALNRRFGPGKVGPAASFVGRDGGS